MRTRNTGVNSMSEIFAMKKNMASQVAFDTTMRAITRSFYHTKFNMNQEIRSISDDMRDIQSSTGYTLNQVRSPRPDGRTRRAPNAPKLYLPPIGVRLVEKYVGFDVKRRKSLFKQPTEDDIEQMNKGRNTLPQVRTNFRNILMHKAIPITITKPDMNEAQRVSNGRAETRTEVNGSYKRADRGTNKGTIRNDSCGNVGESGNDVKKVSHTAVGGGSNVDNLGRNVAQRGYYVDKTGTANDERGMEEDTHEDTAYKMAKEATGTSLKEALEESSGGLVFYTAERRSSRSTYRKRNSSRLLSRSEALRQHNMQASSDSSMESGRFFLDYGDGKLHTAMEVPRVKDCARPWCNPMCKTCQARSKSRPCFIIIPASNQDRQSMVLLQKRRASMFPVYKDDSDVTQEEDVDAGQQSKLKAEAGTDEDDYAERNDKEDDLEENCANADELENEQTDDEEKDQESDEDDERIPLEIDKLLHINRDRVRRGVDKDRIGQLAQPRGSRPAEVRFSKWSLRKRGEQMREEARCEELSKIEKNNLTMIQGKISLFLAVLNQCETKSVPTMVHLPIREHVQAPRRRREKKSARGRKRVAFKTKPRVRPPS